jgi:hypothetical protein
MTYGRGVNAHCITQSVRAAVSHSAELVRGHLCAEQSPLIRPFGAPSPQGEKGAHRRVHPSHPP